MELKRGTRWLALRSSALLIVPYGIETAFQRFARCNWGNLLIVPYGIETNITYQRLQENPSFNCTLWN